jgi:predicted nucleotidyltransferase
MPKANLPLRIEVPDGAEVYVFGSAAVNLQEANDIDILVVYSNEFISASEIYDRIMDMRGAIEARFRLATHVLCLSASEEAEEQAVRRLRCVPFEPWLKKQKC